MNMPLWSVPLGTLFLTSFFFISKEMNYSVNEWIFGNGLIGLGVVFCYIFIKFKENSK